ncbi:PC-esterase domain-containing protein 1B-like [Ctenodactylus gundi]
MPSPPPATTARLQARDVRQLLHNKFVVIMGDSIQRTVYKDLVLLLQKDCLLSPQQLKAKGELSFEHDVLLEGGRRGRMRNHAHYHYREVRQFCSGHHLVRFYFLTRAYSSYVEAILAELHHGQHAPDVVIMNSCLWDLSRYQNFPRKYQKNLETLFRRLDRVLLDSCLLIWNTAMPVAENVTARFLPPESYPTPGRLRLDVMEANFYSSLAAARRGFDVLDLHFHFRHAGQHRLRDGVHWDEVAHRQLSQLLLTHVADAWGVDLPGREPSGRRWQARDYHSRSHSVPPEYRHFLDHRGDSGEGSLSWRHPPTLTHLHYHQRPSVAFRQARNSFRPSNQGSSLRPDQPLQHTSRSRVECVGGDHMAVSDPRLGPIRRISNRRARASPPYSSRSGESHRRHGRGSSGTEAALETRPE